MKTMYLVVVVCTLLLAITWWSSRQASYMLLRQDGLNELFRYRSSIQNLLDRYRTLPEILAATSLLRDGLKENGSLQGINLYLEQMARASEASVIYLMDLEGNTIATSNWSSAVNFLGGNFSYRPYFQHAMNDGEGFYSALGTTSGTRGFYYGRRIDIEGQPAGVIVVKRDLDDIELAWESPWDRGEAAFVVTDSAGVVFISTRRDWLFHTLQPLSEQQKTTILSQRRYDNQPLSPMIYRQAEQPASLVNTNSQLRRIGLPGQRVESFLTQSVAMPETDWRLHLFIKTTTVNQIGVMSTLTMAGILVLALVGWLYRREKRRRFLEIKAARDILDDRVQIRTRALTEANHKLAQEVKQHRETAESLRSTRNELIQAAKLAVLGQMSAGINHELNQPLTAIRSYTENAEQFLQRNRPEIAASNMQEVLKLTDHMAGIIGQLKTFARKGGNSPEPVELTEALKASVTIIRPLLRKHQVPLELEGLDSTPLVIAGDLVQLEQVFVNLLSNAIQSAANVADPKVKVCLAADSNQAQIQVSDNGEGLPENSGEAIFEPFYTTRSIDQGLGLGLSISRHIIESLAGAIKADNRPGGGALFTVELPLMPQNQTSKVVRVEGVLTHE